MWITSVYTFLYCPSGPSHTISGPCIEYFGPYIKLSIVKYNVLHAYNDTDVEYTTISR